MTAATDGLVEFDTPATAMGSKSPLLNVHIWEHRVTQERKKSSDTFSLISLYITLYHSISLYITLYHSISLYITLYHSLYRPCVQTAIHLPYWQIVAIEAEQFILFRYKPYMYLNWYINCSAPLDVEWSLPNHGDQSPTA